MKRMYEEPSVLVTNLQRCDVITTSGATEDPMPDDSEIPANPDWMLPWD